VLAAFGGLILLGTAAANPWLFIPLLLVAGGGGFFFWKPKRWSFASSIAATSSPIAPITRTSFGTKVILAEPTVAIRLRQRWREMKRLPISVIAAIVGMVVASGCSGTPRRRSPWAPPLSCSTPRLQTEAGVPQEWPLPVEILKETWRWRRDLNPIQGSRSDAFRTFDLRKYHHARSCQ
jgi:hypothetical protein